MITSNVLQRIFRIKYGDRIGTCFTIDEGNQRYLITAKHIVENIADRDTVEIYYNGNWANLKTNLIGHGSGDTDISVLTGDLSFSVDHPFLASMAHLCYSQDVYFLGFPNVVDIDKLAPSIQKLNRNFPLPIARRGIVCWMNEDYILLDGQGNKGFSGGPVVFKPSKSNLYSVAGIIVNYEPEIKPVYETELEAKMNGGGKKPVGYYRDNSGIITAHSIKHVLNLIENPI